jgi:hypothetical protein
MMVKDLKSVGMRLHRNPRVPSRQELAAKAGKMLPRKVHPTWEPYLGIAHEVQPSQQQQREEISKQKQKEKIRKKTSTQTQPKLAKEMHNAR